MVIRRLKIRNFGKIREKTLELSPGINVLYGENESGKTTVHTFIKSMFFGLSRQRGKAARNDAYSTYEPWENPVVYGGTLWFESGGKDFRLTRNFHKTNLFSELICETDGECLDVEKGDMDSLLGDISEAVYENTVSVAQLKSVTGADLVRELQNYMASYQGTGDSSIDLGRTMQMLKMSRKGYQVQADRHSKEIAREQEKLHAKMELLRREIDDLQEQNSQNQKKKQSLLMGLSEEGGEEVFDEQMEDIRRKKRLGAAGMILLLLLGVVGTAAMALFTDFGPLCAICAAAAVIGMIPLGFLQKKWKEDFEKYQKLKAKWISRKEKIQWNQDSLSQMAAEKKTAYTNLAEEYREYEQEACSVCPEQTEIQALNLAMRTIERLSGRRNNCIGKRLQNRTSQILGEITGGKYTEVLMDEDFRMQVNTQERLIPLERLSRGTLEQIYFALRMAAGELLCQEPFPVILDDVFGMYDEERLTSVLHWLEKEQKQIIISTCHKREEEILQREGIPYQRLTL